MEEHELEKREQQYQSRKSSLRHVIDILAEYEESHIEEHGNKTAIAAEHGLETHRIQYVLNHWPELVEYRRYANRSPLDPDAVKAAYDDETMQAMADSNRVTSDGGDIVISIDLTLDEVFRAIKLLPGDLGLKVYSQTLESDFDKDLVRRILD